MATKDANAVSDTSADTEILDVDAAASAVDTAATSSPAKGEAEGSDTPNIVRDVVDEREEKPAAAASPAAGDETGEEAGDKNPKKEPDDVNYTDVPFHKHPRFQQVIRRLNAAETDAGRYQNVQRFLDDHGLPSDEAANILTIAAQAKVDPVGAWAAVKPWVQNLLVAAGEVVPDDLQQRVTAGELNREAALEIAKHRAKAEAVQNGQKFKETRAEQNSKRELADKLVSTASDWETDRRVKDPNFAAKLEPLQREIAWLHQTEGRPDTPEGVLEQLKKAYKAVNEKFQPAAPRPAARRPAIRPVTGGQVAQNIQAEPKSTLDIIRANRRAAPAG